MYGSISCDTINSAILLAGLQRKHHRGAEIYFAPGSHILNTASLGKPCFHINSSNWKTRTSQWIVFRGAGMNQTDLKLDGVHDTINARGVQRVEWRDLTFSRQEKTVTQGVVVSSNNAAIILDIDAGYPTPGHLLTGRSGIQLRQGRYLRRYQRSEDGKSCRLDISTVNEQVEWSSARQISETRWELTVNWPSGARYELGNLIGVKCKRGGQSYFIVDSNEIVFENIRWINHARGVLRRTSSGRYSNCVIDRMDEGDCLSTAGGGPQLGQPHELDGVHDMVVQNFTAHGTGDDPIAVFIAHSGSVTDVTVYDSFARGVLVYKSPSVLLTNIRTVRCPVCQPSSESKLRTPVRSGHCGY